MNPIQYLINLLQDPRAAIAGWITTLGAVWVYAPLFLIIFIETGVVVMPFLPGDSLLFAAGVFAADGGGLSLFPLLVTVWCAAVLGDQCNFAIGHFFGRRIVASGKIKALTPERIAKTEALLDKYGPLAIFLGRFIPFLRTFVPFFAGIGGMHWRHFVVWNVLGGVTWSSLFTLLGYFFGGVPFVQEHFEWVIILIILISVIPVVAGSLKAALGRKRGKGEDSAAAGASGAGAPADANMPAAVSVTPSVRDLWELNADDEDANVRGAERVNGSADEATSGGAGSDEMAEGEGEVAGEAGVVGADEAEAVIEGGHGDGSEPGAASEHASSVVDAGANGQEDAAGETGEDETADEHRDAADDDATDELGNPTASAEGAAADTPEDEDAADGAGEGNAAGASADTTPVMPSAGATESTDAGVTTTAGDEAAQPASLDDPDDADDAPRVGKHFAS